MKYVFRFIGFLVVVLLIAALALYTLNSFGYLHGPLSKWVRTHAPTQAPTTAQPQDSEPLQTPAPAISFAEP